MWKHFGTGQTRYHGLQFVLAVFLPLAIVASVAAILVFILHLDPSSLLNRGIVYACLFLACLATSRWRFSLARVGLTRRNARLGFLYAGIVLVTSYIFMFVAQPPKGVAHVTVAVWQPVIFFLLVALAEEIWFRGLIFGALYEWKGAWLAIIVSSLLFGLMHVPTQGWLGLRHVLDYLSYPVIRLRTGNIWGLIVVHWLINLANTFIIMPAPDMSTSTVTVSAAIYFLGFPGVAILILFADKRLSKK